MPTLHITCVRGARGGALSAPRERRRKLSLGAGLQTLHRSDGREELANPISQVRVLGRVFLDGRRLAAPLAILLLEYYRRRDWQQAQQAVVGFAKGWGLSFVARFLIGLAINGLWWLWVWIVK